MKRNKGIEDTGARAWEAVLRTYAQVLPVLAAEVQASTGLPLPWYDVLLELSRAEGSRLKMTALGERVVLSRSRASRVVDAMAESGLLIKEPDPVDARVTWAVMTPNGRESLRRAAPVYLEGISREFSKRLTESELRLLLGALSKVVQADPNRSER